MATAVNLRTAVIALACLLLGAPPATPLSAAAGLEPHRPLERELVAGESHRYTLSLAAGAWRIAVEQLGLDVVLEARGLGGAAAGDGPDLTVVDQPLGRLGTETLVVTAAGSLVVGLEVRPREATAGGRYRIELAPLAGGESERLAAATAIMRAGEENARGTPEARRRALEHYRQALSAWSRLGEVGAEAEALHALGVVSRSLDEPRPALEHLRQAVTRWRQIGARSREAWALNDAGLAHDELGETAAARQLFNQALALATELGDRTVAAIIRNNVCLILHRQGELGTALDCYRRILTPLRAAGARHALAAVLNNLGGVHYLLGDPEEALRWWEEALALRREAEDRRGEAQVLLNLAALWRYFGDSRAALAHYDQALPLLRQTEDRRGEAAALNNLGYGYLTLGKLERAESFFHQALSLRRKIEDRRGEAVTRTNLGNVHHARGKPAAALELHRQALSLRRARGDRRGEGRTLVWIGRDRLALGEPAAALAAFDQAEELLADNDRRNTAQALVGRGQALLGLARPQEALASFRQAVKLHREVRYAAGEAGGLTALAEAERRLGTPEAALRHAEEAVAILERLRTHVGTPELGASFLGSRRQAWELRIELHMELARRQGEAGHVAAALGAAEEARARGLLELLGESGIELRRGVDPALLRRRTALVGRLRLLGRRQQRTRETEAEVERSVQTVLAELDRVEAEIRRTSPQAAALLRPDPLDVGAVQELLDGDTTLLEFSLGERRSFLWRVTASAVEGFELPARAVIEDLARRAHGELGTLTVGAVRPGARGRSAAAELGTLLLAPLIPRLTTPRLAVVADGALHYVPFAALPLAGGEPLIERYEVVYLPSASALALLRQLPARRAPTAVAVVADPVFAPRDPRRAPGAEPSPPATSYDRLPSTRREAEAIAAAAPADGARLLLGAAASRRAVRGGALADAAIVHFATHGVIDAGHPELSGLVLSEVDEDGRPDDGFLGLSDLYELELAARLVVLSGCRTALGKEIRGEGLVGLTRGFMYAGAPRVVASLWPVEDRAAAELMSLFYRRLLGEGQAPAAALRAAQLELRSRRRFRNPPYWAAFVLQGDWR